MPASAAVAHRFMAAGCRKRFPPKQRWQEVRHGRRPQRNNPARVFDTGIARRRRIARRHRHRHAHLACGAWRNRLATRPEQVYTMRQLRHCLRIETLGGEMRPCVCAVRLLRAMLRLLSDRTHTAEQYDYRRGKSAMPGWRTQALLRGRSVLPVYYR